MSSWNRWLGYARAKLRTVVKDAHEELDRAESKLRKDSKGKPWLDDDATSPSYEDVRARIEQRAPRGDAPKPSGNDAFDLAEQQRAADERLADMRKSLGLDADGDPPPPKP